MIRLPIYASATLMFGLATAAGCLSPAPAGAHPAWALLDCGARMDFCLQACDDSVPGGPPLAQCNNYCARGTGVCEASRIPRPVSYRTHSRYPIVRK
jgi:hypothetical protein